MRVMSSFCVVVSLVACGGGRVEGQLAGDCSDGADNDLDGQFDCADPNCSGSTVCQGGGTAGGSGATAGGAATAGGSGASAGGTAGNGGNGGGGGAGGGDSTFCSSVSVAGTFTLWLPRYDVGCGTGSVPYNQIIRCNVTQTGCSASAVCAMEDGSGFGNFAATLQPRAGVSAASAGVNGAISYDFEWYCDSLSCSTSNPNRLKVQLISARGSCTLEGSRL